MTIRLQPCKVIDEHPELWNVRHEKRSRSRSMRGGSGKIRIDRVILIGNTLEETAYHEAGHIVIAAAVDLDLKAKGIVIYEVENVADGWTNRRSASCSCERSCSWSMHCGRGRTRLGRKRFNSEVLSTLLPPCTSRTLHLLHRGWSSPGESVCRKKLTVRLCWHPHNERQYRRASQPVSRIPAYL